MTMIGTTPAECTSTARRRTHPLDRLDVRRIIAKIAIGDVT